MVDKTLFGSNLFAICGDIHANLESLDAVFFDAKSKGVSQIICTGDIVGYGASPSRCLKLIRDLNCPTVLGNHDSYAATGDGLNEFNPNAMSAILWTREHLSDDEKAWLVNLPMQIDLSDKVVAGRQAARLVHSSLIDPEKWCYILKPENAEAALRVQESDIVFFGHTHVPSLFSFNSETKEFRSKSSVDAGVYELEPGWKHLVNPGSVGQPRDRDNRASYAIYDSQAGTIEIRRVEYDIATAQKKIKAAGLPLRNAERLSHGR